MKHFSEEDLIAYQLHESPTEGAISRHLENCSECADLSESIAETLRVFSADPVPTPDLEHNWQRLRGNLSVLTPERSSSFELLRWGWRWPVAGLVATVLILLTLFVAHIQRTGETKHNMAVNGHGPLTIEPTDPAIANHLDAAERLLTEVNNSSGPLDSTIRDQAHALSLQNAVYVRDARDKGDLASAAVLENFGRVLTTLDNEPSTPHSTWRLRLEMNTSGLLLDIRILRQNDDHSQGVTQ
jgi:predicted anti-sigma-YlaC factor YlaD